MMRTPTRMLPTPTTSTTRPGPRSRAHTRTTPTTTGPRRARTSGSSPTNWPVRPVPGPASTSRPTRPEVEPGGVPGSAARSEPGPRGSHLFDGQAQAGAFDVGRLPVHGLAPLQPFGQGLGGDVIGMPLDGRRQRLVVGGPAQPDPVGHVQSRPPPCLLDAADHVPGQTLRHQVVVEAGVESHRQLTVGFDHGAAPGS